MIKAIFCDLDGTLVDTKMANFLSYSQALAEVGQDFDFETFLTTWGKDSRTFLVELYPTLTEQTIRIIQRRKAELFSTHVSNTTINEALLMALQQYKLSGVRLGLVTTAKRASLESLKKHNVALSIFDFIVAGDDVSHAKPHPAAYLEALSQAGCKSEEALTFEDSDVGEASAKAAGIAVIRIMFGGN